MSPWILAIRPRTLPASISPIILASALAFTQQQFSWVVFFVATFCALCLQVAVNLANDYFDAKSGVDTEERLGPTRVTQSGLISEKSVFSALIIFTLMAFFSGVYLSFLSGWEIFALGMLSIAGVYAYSGGPWPLASHGLGEVTVLIFFGWVAVGGCYYVHTGELTVLVMSYGTIAGLLSALIMLVNNLRDIETDQRANKCTLAVRFGDKNTRILFKLILIVVVIWHAWLTHNDIYALVIPLALSSWFVAILWRDIAVLHGKELNQLIPKTALLLTVYCFSLSGVLFFLASGIVF
ncbi:1,4-dihydroxy-2-naphthoate polyprenyltransferase [Teredinibacter sp. KSP-S5-2]|uniref:1,4-dihydroxy-2-naphthoate polyprenyltransferase n=1 Tax=Teredinibacter sp. KSP-S5-2 TaxID=3034506 RepID=UPI0029345DFA|nr:1,4-dihydroxy-2-naphthoate polyprenyltransferase [Teredinibacter sp. KSP-S5-2]WNO08911.1 1,4-dihydroxy-2-naphthoate polyprenyltransferase [Teredinibacter sp. KSP-S5-2]